MSDRAALVLNSTEARQRAAKWCATAPPGTRVEFKRSKRTIPQNDRMWAMLTDISKQVEHQGRSYTPDDWKCLFMHALGQEVRFLPSLSGQGFVPIGYRSSDLSKSEMTELIELMFAWGAEHGVSFQEPRQMEGSMTTEALLRQYHEALGHGSPAECDQALKDAIKELTR